MDRSLDVRRTRFVIPELYVGEEMLDKIQSDNFQLLVKDTSPSFVCFHFAINMRPTLVYGADDLSTLKLKNSDFSKLILRDENVIKKIIRYFELNTVWRGYQRLVQFTLGAQESEQFKCKVTLENDHLLTLNRI